ncbi:cyclodeaminase/cyclohydrolase family protein [Actinomadura sp. SCN-SB]|uniref:cyclodeaminase/cyclohydrolase family protein n=1 Tax=Actinomadura sp. SCN-SB TaxID=3373092 RepID=UPI00375219CB
MTSPPPAGRPAYRDMTVAGWLDAVAAAEPAPGGGGAAAFTAALGAALVAMAARFAPASYGRAGDIAARADALRERALTLAEEDATAYRAVLEAYRLPKDTEGRRDRIGKALARACEVPLEIAEGAAEVAALGADIGEHGNPNLIGDAATGVHLAVAAVRSAAGLVRINARLGDLGTGPGDRARALLRAAESAAGRLG